MPGQIRPNRQIESYNIEITMSSTAMKLMLFLLLAGVGHALDDRDEEQRSFLRFLGRMVWRPNEEVDEGYEADDEEEAEKEADDDDENDDDDDDVDDDDDDDEEEEEEKKADDVNDGNRSLVPGIVSVLSTVSALYLINRKFQHYRPQPDAACPPESTHTSPYSTGLYRTSTQPIPTRALYHMRTRTHSSDYDDPPNPPARIPSFDTLFPHLSRQYRAAQLFPSSSEPELENVQPQRRRRRSADMILLEDNASLPFATPVTNPRYGGYNLRPRG